MGKDITGIFPEQTMEEYLEMPYNSASKAKAIGKSPKLYKHEVIDGNSKTSKSLSFGTLIHTLILEPDHFDKTDYVIKDKDMKFTTKEGKEWRDKQMEAGKTILEWKEYQALQGIVKSIQTEMFSTKSGKLYPAANYIANGKPEVSCVWQHKKTGEYCKFRPDFLNVEDRYMLDIKSTTKADPDGFAKEIAKWEYEISAAMSIDGISQLTGTMKEEWSYIFVAVGKDAPYMIGFYDLEVDDIELGRQKYEEALEAIQYYRSKNWWPSNTFHGVGTLKLPAWAYYKQTK